MEKNTNVPQLLAWDDLMKAVKSEIDWEVYWDSFQVLLYKTIKLESGEKVKYVPIVFKHYDGEHFYYSWKIQYLGPETTSIELSKGMLESESILLLLILLVKTELQTRYSWISESMSLKEIALALADRQILISESVRLRYISACESLNLYLKHKNLNEI